MLDHCSRYCACRRQQTSQLWMEGRGRGEDCFVLQSYPIWRHVSTIYHCSLNLNFFDPSPNNSWILRARRQRRLRKFNLNIILTCNTLWWRSVSWTFCSGLSPICQTFILRYGSSSLSQLLGRRYHFTAGC